MGKNNKKGPKANVFKVAGAKSLKKTKAKAVNLGLKDVSFICSLLNISNLEPVFKICSIAPLTLGMMPIC